MNTESRCHTCGKPMKQSTTGRASVYCSASCRQRAYRERKLLGQLTREQPITDDQSAAIIHDIQLSIADCRDAARRANPLYRPIFADLASQLESVLNERGLL